jgi:beta-glucosidase
MIRFISHITICSLLFFLSVNHLLSQDLTSKDDLMKIKERREKERSSDKKIEGIIDDLLSKMTIEEKIGQMIQIEVGQFSVIKEYDETESGITEIHLDTAKFLPFLIKYPIGSILNGYGFTRENWTQFERSLQNLNKKYTRLNIPIIHGADHQHGANYIHGSTIFPHSINMGATFNKDLSFNEGRIVGLETADVGHHWIFGPIADIGVNPLWPRIFETYGEDTYLCGVLSLAFTEGNQSIPEVIPYKQALCTKHFIGYSDPDAGWDRTPSSIPIQYLYEFHIPPFEKLINNGIHAIMLNSGELNGKAVHGSYDIVTELLRDQLNFRGVVLTDWDDINKMYKYHKAARTSKEATLIAVNAGIDMTMAPYNLDFGDHILELIKEGKLTEERIDLSVSRILRMKLSIDLFKNQMPNKAVSSDKFGSVEHMEFSKKAAEESIVLLKNNELLPLSTGSKILVAGLNADIKRSLCGGWTYRWFPKTDDIFPENMNTVFSALKDEFKKVKLSDYKNLEKDAEGNDIIILALGEMPHAEGFGNINDIILPKEQKLLVRKALKTGKKLIILMIGARPLIATEEFDECDAFLWVGLPGIFGADALANILKGNVNPSGKMSISYPAFSGHFYNYNHKPSHTNYDIPPADKRTTIASFGDGLSYSELEYGEISLSDSVLLKDGFIKAKITVKNLSDREANESVLWYITDDYASITRPVRSLKFFEKRPIKANSQETFTFQIKYEDILFPDDSGKLKTEPGYFTISTGGKSIKFRLEI